MKSVKSSSLNPYAAAYIPLSRRNAALEEIDYNLMGKDDHVNNLNQQQQQQQTTSASSSDDYNLKGKIIIHGSNGSTSQSCSTIDDRYNDKETNMVEEFDMALTYLQMICPGISEESLTEVFLANKGDLEATIEMLRQLELDIDDCCEHLPDSLDIGDVTEQPGSSGVNATTISQDQTALAASSSSSSLGLGMADSKTKKP